MIRYYRLGNAMCVDRRLGDIVVLNHGLSNRMCQRSRCVESPGGIRPSSALTRGQGVVSDGYVS
jgi:hypothetical protein